MKELTRREMFKELVSKDTLKMVAGSWYGFVQPFKAEQTVAEKPKKESLLSVVRRAEKKHLIHDRKEG